MDGAKIKRALIGGAAALLLSSLAAPAPAAAGTLRVDPVRLEISADRRTATVSVRNDDPTPVTIRAYALTWDQVDGEDRYGESSAVIISPPIFTIAPGATQLIRVGLRSPSAGGRAYRVIVEEVPGASPSGGVQVALRLNLPLFATMQAGTPADLNWSAGRQADGSWAIEAVNRGSGYVRIEPSDAATATGIAEQGGAPFGVVLPNSRRRWIVAQPTIGNQARFDSIARVNQGGGAQAALARD
jgi:fimbrial chaperone protein